MGQMRMFEIVSDKKTEILVTRYNIQEARLFPYKKVARWIFSDKSFETKVPITVTRYTGDNAFETQDIYPGEILLIRKNGTWKVQKNLTGCFMRTWKRFRKQFLI